MSHHVTGFPWNILLGKTNLPDARNYVINKPFKIFEDIRT